MTGNTEVYEVLASIGSDMTNGSWGLCCLCRYMSYIPDPRCSLKAIGLSCDKTEECIVNDEMVRVNCSHFSPIPGQKLATVTDIVGCLLRGETPVSVLQFP